MIPCSWPSPSGDSRPHARPRSRPTSSSTTAPSPPSARRGHDPPPSWRPCTGWARSRSSASGLPSSSSSRPTAAEVRFRIEQVVAADPERVQAALVDPLFLERLASLPKLGRPELLEQRREGEVLHQRVRYRFAGDLNAAARAVLDPARLTWIEES